MPFGVGNPVVVGPKRKNLSTSAFGGFSPLSISGLAAWYKIDSIVSTDGTNVATWADSSGNARDLAQASDSLRPSYETNEVNGLACVRFNGVNDSLSAASFTVAQPYSAFIVMKNTTWNTDEWIWDTSDAAEGGLLTRGTTPGLQIYAGSAFVAENAGLAVGAWGLVETQFSGAASSITVNGGTPTTGDPGTSGINGFVLCAKRGQAAGFSNPDVAEFLIYDSILSASNRNALEAILGAKYGITIA